MVLGEEVVTADGVYGPRTRNAVEAFKRRERLSTKAATEDGGEAGEGDMSREAEAVLRDLHLRTLENRALTDADHASPWRRRERETGERVTSPVADQDVKLLQLSLNQLMGCTTARLPASRALPAHPCAPSRFYRYEAITADGVYGARTQAAIADFQRTFGLPVDGDVTTQLSVVLQALREEAKKPQPRAAPRKVVRTRPTLPAAAVASTGFD